MKTIVVVAAGDINMYRAVAAALKAKKDVEAIHVLPEKLPDIVINGVGYKKIIKNNMPSKSYRISALMEMAAAFSVVDPYGSQTRVERKRPVVDLEKEFELIGQKKSTLSRNDREWVIAQFYKIYETL